MHITIQAMLQENIDLYIYICSAPGPPFTAKSDNSYSNLVPIHSERIPTASFMRFIPITDQIIRNSS